MNIELALEMIEDTGMVFNIGQLEPDTIKELNRRVRHKELAKIRTLWPWRHSGISEKTAYCLPHFASFYEVRKCV